ncbi:hypothetical protein ABMA27_005440 [Loxostege sticticalis]|uniref:Reverse transcriptase domain-containing protein n=1 Tax=Loxostege sticticalis TaxID=481309 RepID=A0ABR3HJ67_LOXSC
MLLLVRFIKKAEVQELSLTRKHYYIFSLLRKRVKNLEKQCYESYLQKAENSIINNPKTFWSYIKSLNSTNSSFPSTMTYGTDSADKGDAICDLFAVYFHSTFLEPSVITTSQPFKPLFEYSCPDSCCAVGDIEIDPNDVLKLLQSLDLNKGAGPDELPPLFIVRCAKSLVAPLCILFKRSIREGVMPDMWKSAFITPIHKKGNKSDVSNYRPISKLCIFSKILERVVYQQLYSALAPSFIPEQHGFLRRRSTTSNLLLSNDFITSSMDFGGQVDAVFTDYSKAFDWIDHVILLRKLWMAGVHGNLLRWFGSYIDNRTQVVVLNGYTSRWMSVPSGVPQGSLLGPLLFTIFVNDIGSCFYYSKFLLFADDMKILKQIVTIEDSKLLQDDLVRFENYCYDNKLDLNVSKCHTITFTRKPNPIKFNYTLKAHSLTHVDHIRDLGVIHDSKLLFDKHVDSIVNKASKALGFLIRSCARFSSLKPIKILFCSYVRSILEYASQIWNPQYKVYSDRIESIQKRFLKYLQYKSKKRDVDYYARCKRHHFLPLHTRRKAADITYLMNIANGHVDSSQLLNGICLRVPIKPSRKRPCLDIPTFRTKYRKNSFFCRASRQFNQTVNDYPHIDLFCTRPAELRRLLTKRFMCSSPDLPT